MAFSEEKNDSSSENVEFASKIFDEYGDFIYKTIRYKVKNRASVDDLYQNFFLSLIARPIPKDTNNIKGYLYRALIHDISDAERQEKKYADVIQKYFKNFKFLINKSHSRNAFKYRKRFEEMLKKNWNRLTPSETEAIMLRYRESCSMTEIARKDEFEEGYGY